MCRYSVLVKKRSNVWPLTKREAAIIKSLEDVFWCAAGLLLSMERRDEPNALENVKKALLGLQRGINIHCKRFVGDAEAMRELRGAYRTLGLSRARMRSAARALGKRQKLR
jgi:hypothetical protein